MNRRDFLRTSFGAGLLVSTGGLSALSSCKSPVDAPLQPADILAPRALRIPQTLRTSGSLTAAKGTAEIFKGGLTKVVTLNGQYLGPTIRVRKGEELNFNFTNLLGEPSTIHWHGMTVPANMDGHPMDAVESGATFNYKFPVLENAGTFWYHAHPDMLTGWQVYNGFSGVLIVEDDEEQALNLPRGEHDLPLVIQDKRFDGQEFVYAPTEEDIITGWLGNKITVNGTPNAFHEVATGLYRIRFLNGSNARPFKIRFKDDRAMHIIGNDCGLLGIPIEVTEFWLGPGERVEALVDFSNDAIGTEIMLESKEFPYDSSHKGATYQIGMQLDIMTFKVTKAATTQYSIPGALVSLQRLNPAESKRTRKFELTMDHSKAKGRHMINGKTFDMHHADFTVPMGDIEIWQFDNNADGFHAMHIHGTQFQIYDRFPSPEMHPTDQGWKDSVIVNANESVRVITRFPKYKGIYMVHCHMLEHEDDGMMLNFEVV